MQRRVLTATGATFSATHPTPGRDLPATPDQWFRPVHTTVSPDGALYLCDMVRHTSITLVTCLKPSAVNSPSRPTLTMAHLAHPDGYPRPSQAHRHHQAAARQNLAIRQGKFPDASMKDLLKQAQSKDANERFLAVLQLGKQEHSRKAHVLAASLMQDPRDKWMRPAVYNALSKGASMAVMDFIRSQPYRVDGTAFQSRP